MATDRNVILRMTEEEFAFLRFFVEQYIEQEFAVDWVTCECRDDLPNLCSVCYQRNLRLLLVRSRLTGKELAEREIDQSLDLLIHLLQQGDEVSGDHLLDQMLTRLRQVEADKKK